MPMPVLVNIGNLASCYSSNQFLEYVEEFKKIESLVRKGKGILKEDAENEFSEEIDLPQDSGVYPSTLNEQESGVCIHSQENTSPSNTEPASKFNRKFKESLKSKGRPKKRTKQLIFNKTSFDKRKKTTTGSRCAARYGEL